jgi:hypothetical protein
MVERREGGGWDRSGLKSGEDGWFCGCGCGIYDGGELSGADFLLGFPGCVGFVEAIAFSQPVHQNFDSAYGPDDLGAWGDGAVSGIDGDLFDGCGCVVAGGFPVAGRSGREIAAGDLKSVEEQAGTARIDGVGGDAAEDFSDRGLEGGGNGRSKVERRLRRWRGFSTGRRAVWW